jgi:hypothetical protein
MRHTLHSGSTAAAAAAGEPAAGLGKAGELWRKFMKELFDRYRPELHYMRGPGPKWGEKHSGGAAR